MVRNVIYNEGSIFLYENKRFEKFSPSVTASTMAMVVEYDIVEEGDNMNLIHGSNISSLQEATKIYTRLVRSRKLERIKDVRY